MGVAAAAVVATAAMGAEEIGGVGGWGIAIAIAKGFLFIMGYEISAKINNSLFVFL